MTFTSKHLKLYSEMWREGIMESLHILCENKVNPLIAGILGPEIFGTYLNLPHNRDYKKQ